MCGGLGLCWWFVCIPARVAYDLIAAQNNTIAVLCAEVETLKIHKAAVMEEVRSLVEDRRGRLRVATLDAVVSHARDVDGVVKRSVQSAMAPMLRGGQTCLPGPRPARDGKSSVHVTRTTQLRLEYARLVRVLFYHN